MVENESGVQIRKNRNLIKADVQTVQTSSAVANGYLNAMKPVEVPDRLEVRTRSGRFFVKNRTYLHISMIVQIYICNIMNSFYYNNVVEHLIENIN